MDNIIISGMDDFWPGEISVIKVYYDENMIAEFQFMTCTDLDGDIAYVTPYIASVKEEFQRQGIGRFVIEQIAEIYIVKFKNVINNIAEDKNDIHYTDAGLSWAYSCRNIHNVILDDIEP